jgi:ATP-dependent DNA helicase RecQ
LERFQAIWGYEKFRPPQGEIVEALCQGRDALIVLPTGGGKSVCFQLPALMQRGVTLVISPLVALMENQVQELRQRRLPAALLHSELPRQTRRRTLQALEQQRLRLLYLSPETLLSPPVWQRLCQPDLVINGLILDEAHCLVQWGETFRPTYRRLGAVRPALQQVRPDAQIAIAAFTATADPAMQRTIQEVLQLQSPYQVQLSPYRPQLRLAVRTVWTPRGRRCALVDFVQTQGRQSGLVYVRTRQASEELATALQQQGWRTAAYHAGLDAGTRRQVEQDWLGGDLQFVVCTSAFGMGVNKPDVRWIVHFHAPNLLSEYVQEVGRAGRDGKPATALMLMSEPTGWLDPSDRQRWQFFERQVRSQHQAAARFARQLPTAGVVDPSRRQASEATALALLHSAGLLEWSDPFHYRLTSSGRSLGKSSMSASTSASSQPMQRYLHSRQCRWQFLLNHFGFDGSALQHCRCDRCQSSH